MAQALDPLGRADEPAGAAHIDLALFRNRLTLALWAMVGEGKGGARLFARQVIEPPAG